MGRFLSDLQSEFRQNYQLDLRALGFMRIGVACIILIDLCIRASDLIAHYTNDGILPLNALPYHAYYFSLHTISGTWQVQAILFSLAGLLATALLLGYKTTWVTFFSWVLLVSLHNRNHLILQGGDDLLRILLFWGIFLPWGKVYSIDKINFSKTESYSYAGAAGIGYMLLIFSLYAFSATLKSSPEWTKEGTAIYYALSLDQMVWPIGKLIYPYPHLLKSLTFIVYYIELLAPVLFFIPLYNATFRLIGILLLTLLHIGIASTLYVGLFYLTGIVSLIGLLPSSIMEKTESFCSSIKTEIAYPDHLSKRKFLYSFREGILVLIIIYSFVWNIDRHLLSRLKISSLGNLLRIEQNWGMFAPTVFKDDGWYILEGTTQQNTLIDLNRNGQAVNRTKPASIIALHKNDRWRKYSENYLSIYYQGYRPYYCHYTLKKWNRENPDQQVYKLQIVYMKEYTLPDYQYSPPKREVLCECTS